MRQSVLDPSGPEADRIADLAAVLFGGGSAILLLVLTAIALALRGPPAVRRILASDRLVVAAGIVFPVVLLSALLSYGLFVMRSTIAQADTKADVTIHVVGEQWWWRVAYAGPNGMRVAEANEVRLPVGRTVEMVLTSPDVIHSPWIPALAGKIDMIPGRTNRMRFVVDRPGIYRGQCAEYCGGPHALMAFDVVALEPPDFEHWLAAPPPDPAAGYTGLARGRELFLASGCGACHAVRGTPATGMVGPDLTRVGGRRTIAAGALQTSREAIALFIRDGQHVKPGNLMPPFAIFTPEDLDKIAAYLMSLR
jgi:cytochrome c oxidase subunit 2